MKFRTLLAIAVSLWMSQAGYSNVTGNDLQNFNATTNGLDFVTVHGSETLFPGIANFGLFANFAINTLPRYKEQAGKDTYLGKVRDSLLASDFNFGLGLTKTIDVGFSLPFVVSQSVNVDGPRGEFGETGLTELRGNLKWRLVGNTDGGIAAIFSFNYNLVKNNPYMGVGAGPVANFELAFDTTIHRTAFAVNLGYRFRDQGDPIENFPIEPLGNQFIGSIAVSQLLPVIDTKLIGEIYTSTPVKDSETGSARSVSASELLIGAKYDYDRHTAIHLGMGSELDHGTASPDWRIYTGINYVTGYRKPDKKVKLVRAPPKSKKKAPKTPAPTPAPAIPALPPELSGQDQYPAEPPGIGDEVFVLRDINFAFDSAHRVLPGAKRTLKALATHLKARGYERIVIEGHTDSIGSENYNIKLGRKRASTIKKYMVQVEGLDPRRLKVLTYGEFRPIADNGNYQGRQLNRRVVFRVIYRKR